MPALTRRLAPLRSHLQHCNKKQTHHLILKKSLLNKTHKLKKHKHI
jgi:hypothetical protein